MATGTEALRTVAMLREHLKQLVEPFRGVIDASASKQRTRFVDGSYVVVVAGPVDAAERSHSPHACPSNQCCGWSQP
ncbi:hypothetical protein RKD23_001002 [Streptomyces sp. SAI-170]